MIYVSMRKSIEVKPGDPVTLADVAECHDTAGNLSAENVVVRTSLNGCCASIGAMDIIRALAVSAPGERVEVIGVGQTWAGELKPGGKNRLMAVLRTVAAAAILFFGAGLALTYFHSDVDMKSAQDEFIRAVSPGADSRWMSIPYAVGVGIGVVSFFGIFSKKRPSPLDLSYLDYQEQVEDYRHQQAKGRS